MIYTGKTQCIYNGDIITSLSSVLFIPDWTNTDQAPIFFLELFLNARETKILNGRHKLNTCRDFLTCYLREWKLEDNKNIPFI